MTPAQIRLLPDQRLHLQHGPIDLICEAWGSKASIEAGYLRARRRFEGLLAELVLELPSLRRPNKTLIGPIARTMGRAVAPFRPNFITPMAAVAGAVAEAVLAEMVGPGISRAYVNNGGDIALYLAQGEHLSCAIAGTRDQITVHYSDPVRGIATSGWRGRSWSLGIADCVTVLAKTASMADAAATMIANAVDLPGHSQVTRSPASDLQADSDLGTRLVTVGVGPLSLADVNLALRRGAKAADAFHMAGLIEQAALFLQGESRRVGSIVVKEPAIA